ncbi:sigma-70 family RNA polymerase sigma factor [Brevibacillus ruminantium]|uniref:Sigma-70 family RNA polymerase sigma factor n=1 Tax=Brevibacillus ruminantium TaxID=2950604 RepID=A0ABY4WI75_9BACL|nr:sigma-70 family RNA polymerase sigma factor [Brevibacillus ruminantium]USG66404.1 sigma-70 family RNA polymerase sigma factor [Brevibacillus ruminantium]
MSISDENLTAELKKRNPAALEYAMNLYGKHVYALAHRIMGGMGKREDIEECVSDVFITAWKKIGEFDESKGSWRTWLLILAKYKALDYRRALQRRAKAPSPDDPPAQMPVEDVVISRERSAEIVRLVDSLSEPDRTIFIRRYFSYESMETIATAMGLTKRAVENRLFRTRQILKQQLQPEGGEDSHETY